MNRMDLEGAVVVGLALMVALGVPAALAVYEYWHPCLKSESYPCTTTTCATFVPFCDGDGNCTPVCTLWDSRPDTCTRCVLRGDRDAMPAEVP